MRKLEHCKLVAITKPLVSGIETAEEFVCYAARVSNPGNQMNTTTAPKLLSYLIRKHHWSPFEMVHLAVEINTTRDVGRQILRHWSMRFQEFSTRYAVVNTENMVFREARLQDTKNRQNSLVNNDENLEIEWQEHQMTVALAATEAYQWAIEKGIAMEQARVVLPEGMTPTTLYMASSLRSFIHYYMERFKLGVVQKEHVDIAEEIGYILKENFPSVYEAIVVE